MALSLDQWIITIQASPILSGQQCNDLRESMHAGAFDLTKIKKVFQACSYVDFDNSHIVLSRILINVCCNYLFDDEAPGDDTGFIYDTIPKTLGDTFLRELDKAVIPTQLRTDILIAVGNQHNGNLSTKLQTEIDNVIT